MRSRCRLSKLLLPWGPLPLFVLSHLLAQPLLLFPQLGSELGAEILRLEDLPDLHLGILEGSTLEPFDCLILRFHLPDPEPGDEFLRLGKRSVDHRPLSLGELDPRALRAGLESLCREH